MHGTIPSESKRTVELPTFDLSYVVEQLRRDAHYAHWSGERFDDAVAEYRKFLAMCKLHPDEHLLPGRAVDAIWHRHILNTKKYMADSDEYLGRYLHHNPHMRMEKETSEPSTAWLNTIRVYKATFGMEPTQSWLVGQADCDCND
jgi:hypothetical protein